MKKSVFVLAALLVVGCAYIPYAREAKKKPREGGVIALHTDPRPEDRQKADSLMAMNCGSDATVKVMEEGEVVVGQRTNSSGTQRAENSYDDGLKIGGISFGGGGGPGTRMDSSQETTQMREWQISYVCEPIGRSAAPAPMAAPPAPMKRPAGKR